jgi:o-succinylbenzoate synthase
MEARYTKYILAFKRPSGTSRGILRQKETYFIELRKGNRMGIGECGLLRGLSIDDVPHYEEQLAAVCQALSRGLDTKPLCTGFPSIQMGVEMALLSLKSKTPYALFDTAFTSGIQPIPINGVIWMGSMDFMRKQLADKIEAGFDCIKLKIGALDFQQECALLEDVRKHYSASQISLRVDANGAFNPKKALEKLQTLAAFDLHSIEQPIAAGQVHKLKELCATTPLPIALDEELIGIHDTAQKTNLLDTIRPQYIILKPSLLGGFAAAEEWITLAEERNIGWWVTSALESNIGLNAIAQWTSSLNTKLPQGLGTGGLYTNNVESPLVVDAGVLRYDKTKNWVYPH